MTQLPAPDRGPAGEPARDPRLAGFAEGGGHDTRPPSAALAVLVEDMSGSGWRCPGADDDELTGLLGRWEALGAWAEAGKLGVVRELIRRRARPGTGGHLPMHGDLPDQWHQGTAHEVSGALGISIRSADSLIALAWDLRARLPATGAALAAGLLSPFKAKLISEELKVLPDDLAAAAEKLILDQVTGLTTPGQLGKLAAQVVCTVDPDGAAKRRERAEREQARVAFWRDNGGACALAAFGLPTDQALAANDAIDTRARQYKAAKTRPEARLDQLRVLAFLDILNGITLDARLALDRAARAARAQDGTHGADRGDAGDRANRDQRRPSSQPGATGPDGDGSGGDGTTDSGGHPRGTHGNGPGRGGQDTADANGDEGTGNSAGNPGTPGGNGGPPPAPATALTARVNLTIPLATLLGLAERPGAAHGLGPLDPALTRDLAAAAANSAHSQWCMTITDTNGVAIGHGCAKLARTTKTHRGKAPPPSRDGPQWDFTQRDEPGPPSGYGTWTLSLPGGRHLTVKLAPIPVSDCDHRHQTSAYQPGDTLRHLVQIRDGTCTFPTCTRHARESDFEHTTPYDKGGQTCACNGAARSRRCHGVKQSEGWTVTQPQPGRHQWTTPSGRTYTQGPMHYPA